MPGPGRALFDAIRDALGDLPLHVVGGELGVGDDVEENVGGQVYAVRRDARPVDGDLLVGGGIDDTADSLYRLGYCLGRWSATGAFEEEVLDEVRNAPDAVTLEA